MFKKTINCSISTIWCVNERMTEQKHKQVNIWNNRQHTSLTQKIWNHGLHQNCPNRVMLFQYGHLYKKSNPSIDYNLINIL